MSGIEVLSPGGLASIQDLGRRGLTHLGISPGGAADPVALVLGNRLVNNLDGAAAIELTMTGGSFRFHEEALIAISGADCKPALDGVPMAMWTSFRVKPGEKLNLGAMSGGVRSYLCVHGGVDATEVLGSRANFLGGTWAGSPLREGAILGVRAEAAGSASPKRVISSVRRIYRAVEELRVTPGPQQDWFSDETREIFYSSPFEITTDSNRRGSRLRGPAIESLSSAELQTEGVAAGAIQITSGGQPVILFCEQQTTGGYPKIANVIRADLFLLGQLRPGSRIRFREVSLERAWQLNREREQLWQTAAQSI